MKSEERLAIEKQVKQEEEVTFWEDRDVSGSLGLRKKDIQDFNRRITKLKRESLGADRPKSFNPYLDAHEKNIRGLQFPELVIKPKEIKEVVIEKKSFWKRFVETIKLIFLPFTTDY